MKNNVNIAVTKRTGAHYASEIHERPIEKLNFTDSFKKSTEEKIKLKELKNINKKQRRAYYGKSYNKHTNVPSDLIMLED